MDEAYSKAGFGGATSDRNPDRMATKMPKIAAPRWFSLALPLFPALAVAFLACGQGAFAAEASAKAFVTAIYQTYVGKDAKGVPLHSPKFKTLITPRLLKLIDADGRRAARRGDVPKLDGDPFVDAQDWDIKSFTVDIADTAPDRAQAKIAFVDAAASDKKPVTLDLIKTKAGWRIDDFNGATGSLRQLLGKK
jgi:hypothetical protein